MAKVLVLYHSVYGHVETMAGAMAEGAEAGGGTVTVKRVPETVPEEIQRAAHYKMDQASPIASPDDLVDYDAIIVGTGTRYGRLSGQMAQFWDQTGSLWAQGKLVGKIGSAFGSTASQHGGQETTLFSVITGFLHHGMIVVGLPYAYKGMLDLSAVHGGTPYGATTIAAADGSRQPSDIDLGGARFQGRLVAETAGKLFG